MTRKRLYRRIIRRETHSSRSVAAVIIVLLLMIAAGWLGTEIVLHLMGANPLVASPSTMARALAGDGGLTQAQLVATGVIALAAGVIVLIITFSPGRRGRHSRLGDRVAVIVDDAVFASGAATKVAAAANVSRDQVRVSVGKRTVEAEITPVSGLQVAREEGESMLRREIEEMDLRPALRGQLRVRERGVVGA